MWPDWLKVLQLKPRFLFAFWFFSVLILFMPVSLADKLGITQIRESYRSWIGIATSGFFAIWIVQLWPSFKQWWRSRRQQSEILKFVKTLSEDERLLLAYCLDRNQQTVRVDMFSPMGAAAASLHQKGLMEPAEGLGSAIDWPYTIPTFVWKYLQAHKSRIVRPELRQRFDEIERSLLSELWKDL